MQGFVAAGYLVCALLRYLWFGVSLVMFSNWFVAYAVCWSWSAILLMEC